MSDVLNGRAANVSSPLTANVTAFTSGGGGGIRVTTAAPHLFGPNDMIYMETGLITGFYVVSAVIDSTNFELAGTTYTVTSTGTAIDTSLTPQVQVPTDGDEQSLQISGMLSSQQAILDRDQYMQAEIVMLGQGASTGWVYPSFSTFGYNGTGAGGTPSADPGQTGVIGTGGSGRNEGVIGYGTGKGVGVVGIGGPSGAGGDSDYASAGIKGLGGGSTGSYGVWGLGTGTYAGVFGYSESGGPGGEFTGNVSAYGVKATGGSLGGGIIAAAGGGTNAGIVSTGSGAGAGTLSTGGATGAGVEGIGGSTSGVGVVGLAVAGNSAGLTGQGYGSGAGISATAGATGTGGVFNGGSSSGSGVSATAQGGNSDGIDATGAGTGSGATLTAGGSSFDPSVNGYGGPLAANGIGGPVHVDSHFGYSTSSPGRNNLWAESFNKAQGYIVITSGVATTYTLNVASTNQTSTGIIITFAQAMANATYTATSNVCNTGTATPIPSCPTGLSTTHFEISTNTDLTTGDWIITFAVAGWQ